MLSHAFIQAVSTVANPYSLFGIMGLSEFVNSGYEIKEAQRSARRFLWMSDPDLYPLRPVAVSPKLVAGRRAIEKQIDEHIERLASRQRLRRPVQVVTGVTMLLPVGLAVFHHAEDATRGSGVFLSNVLKDIIIAGSAHGIGLIAGIAGGVLFSMLAGEVGARFGRGATASEAGSSWGGSLVRLFSTFGTSYLMTGWWH